jgi:hypothetical protein
MIQVIGGSDPSRSPKRVHDVPHAAPTRGAAVATTVLEHDGRRAVLDVLHSFEPVIRRIALCVALYSVPLITLSQPVLDPDIWWHLRTGQWVMEHGWVPASDPFSTFGSGRPWMAYSWLFEIVSYEIFRGLGLLGILLFRAVMIYAVAVALHRLLITREPRFVRTACLLAAAFVALLTIGTERPWHFTVLFSILTVGAIEEIRQGQRTRAIWVLPLIFALWANIHIQFVIGLGFLGLAAICGLIHDHLGKERSHSRHIGSTRRLIILLIACVLATGVNPYGFGLYRVVLEYGGHSAVLNIIQEHRAPEFRTLSEWCLVGLGGMAAFALGRRAFRDTYSIALLAISSYLAFHSARDGWTLVLAALVVLTSDPPKMCPTKERFDYKRLRVLEIGSLVALLLALSFWWKDLSPERLREEVRRKYPEQAAAFIERNEPPGPIYNQLNWGGYLIWRLPGYPVAIDGRTNLQGDDRIERSERTWSAKGYRCSDPEFQAARIIVAERTTALAEVLRLDPLFERIYDDSVAVVFRSRAGEEGPRKSIGDVGSITSCPSRP